MAQSKFGSHDRLMGTTYKSHILTPAKHRIALAHCLQKRGVDVGDWWHTLETHELKALLLKAIEEQYDPDLELPLPEKRDVG